MAAPNCHNISVVGTGSSYKNKEGKKAWGTKVFLDYNLIHPEHEISDPFSEEEHPAVIEYLEQLLVRKHDIKSTATETSMIIDDCRSNLFAQLDLPVLSRTQIRIDICECGDPTKTAQTDTICRLPWELLESPDHWHIPDPRVTVRRIVEPAVVGPELERVSSWSTDDSINILLVVARPLTIGASSRYQSVIPSFALSAIQDAQKKSDVRQDTPRINLEIVRPGTYKALQEHLQRTTRDKGRGYFHTVHFDLHGRIENNMAYLRFANRLGDLVDKPAWVVGELLAEHGVPSVVINACESATASKGVDANLGRIFAQKKIFNILAMSYRFSGSAATIFLTSFYENLLIKSLPFSEAAGRARETLRKQRGRESRSGLQCDIQDWFVPVMYMGKRDLQITPSPRNFQRSPIIYKYFRWTRDERISFILGIYWWLSMVLPHISRFLRLCSPRIPALPSPLLPRGAKSTSSLTAQARRHPHMVCLGVEAFDDRQDHQDPLVLDSFILNLEHTLCVDEHIYLHGPPTAGKSFFLDRLSHLWLSTNFADRIYVIQARMFLEGWFPAQLRDILYWIQGHSRFLYATAQPPRSENGRPKSDPRTVVVLEHVDQLFSSDLTSQEKAQAKARLCAFLSNVVGGIRGKTYTLRPYLILVGRKGDDWLHHEFGDMNFDLTPIFLDSRPALHHLQ